VESRIEIKRASSVGGDITTLANPEVVEQIKHHVQSEKLSRGQVPRELSAQEQKDIEAFGKAE